jgi:hypothetical protein
VILTTKIRGSPEHNHIEAGARLSKSAGEFTLDHICIVFVVANFIDTEVIHRKSKSRQHSGQNKKDQRTNNDLQNTTQKIKDRVALTPLEIRSQEG